jgi:hypothetical protein
MEKTFRTMLHVQEDKKNKHWTELNGGVPNILHLATVVSTYMFKSCRHQILGFILSVS